MSNPYQPQDPQPYQGQPYQSQPYQGQPNQPEPPNQLAPSQGYQAAPYGQPYPPVAAVLPEHPKANTILILGIVGLVVPVVSFVAWVMGNGVVKEIRASGVKYSNEQYATIGRILGIVMSIIQIVSAIVSVIAVIFWILFIVGVAATAGN